MHAVPATVSEVPCGRILRENALHLRVSLDGVPMNPAPSQKHVFPFSRRPATRTGVALPSAFLSVDPGGSTGWVLWNFDGHMLTCGLSNEPFTDIPSAPVLVIEEPHEGEGKATKGDLITLSRRMGMVIGSVRAPEVHRIKPVQWKRSVPKMVRTPLGITYPATDMIAEQMTVHDVGIYTRDMTKVAPSVRHNTLDAIGLGIWWMQKNGVRTG